MRNLLLAGFALFIFECSSQTTVQPCDSTTQAAEGTFHVSKKLIATEGTSSSKEVLTPEILCLIEQKRQLNDTVTHIIDMYEIVIYPKQQKKK
jgi:hypothetical protein